ncbi:MAG: T9SS type A sorting domain-containing protein [bacterium]|nr:T9SS type A sorting domain-containing protein [bacterium]
MENLELTVYPNPSMDEIFFKGLPSHLTSIHYRILDISGRAVSSGILPAFNASVNVHNLQPGMYVIGLEIDGEMNTLRFVVAQ